MRPPPESPAEPGVPPGARDLVLALCHELGNLLAGVRLAADLLGRDEGARMAGLAARAGSLAGLVPALLRAPDASPSLDPALLLEGLRRDLDPSEAVEIAAEAPETLPAVVGDAEALHHLLLAELRAALEDVRGTRGGPPRARAASAAVRLCLERTAEGVAVGIERPGAPPPDEPAVQPSGAALTRAIGASLLGRWSGRVALRTGAGRWCVVYELCERRA